MTRMLAGTTPIKLEVTEVTPELITCGWWTFDPKTGAEIDDDLGWGPPPKRTGSYIVRVTTPEDISEEQKDDPQD